MTSNMTNSARRVLEILERMRDLQAKNL